MKSTNLPNETLCLEGIVCPFRYIYHPLYKHDMNNMVDNK